MLKVLKIPSSPNSTITRGDTWRGLIFTIDVEGTPVNLTGASAKCTFRSPAESWTVDTNSGITILNGVSGQIAIDAIQELNVKPGVYLADFQITFANGDIVTYCQIEMTVTDDISK